MKNRLHGMSHSDARLSAARLVLGAFVLGVMLLCHGLSYAQTGQGTITGVVRDAKGAVMSHANVGILETSTGTVRNTMTDSAGVFNVKALNPGVYQLTATFQGFQKSVTNNINVSAGGTTSVSPVLQVGSANTTVTVNAAATLLTKDSSDVSTTINHTLVQTMPYPERSSLEAVLLAPGVDGDALQPGGIGRENPTAFTSLVVPGAALTVGGAPPGGTSILVDGSDVTQTSIGRAGLNLSGFTVGETTVITGGLSAQYGLTSSGVIVQASKAGTNQYHGALDWRHGDPWLNAYPVGTQAANDVHQNFFGLYLGGPVWIPKIYDGHKRTFFFVSVEPSRLRAQYAQRATLLTPDELAGHLNNSLGTIDSNVLQSQGAEAAIAAPRPPGSGVWYEAPHNAEGFPSGMPYMSSAQYQQTMGPLSDCGSVWIAANPGATACPNDLAPQLAHNPFAQFVFSQLPTPSNPGPYVKFDRPDGLWANNGTNATEQFGVLNTDNRFSIRVDQQFGNSDEMFLRYTHTPVVGDRFFALAVSNPLQQIPSDEALGDDAALGYTHVFSSQLVNNFHFGYMRNLQNRFAPHISTDYAAKYGLTPASVGYGFPYLLIQPSTNYGTQQLGVSLNFEDLDENYLGGDDLTWTHGNHVIQIGADIRRLESNQYDFDAATGGYYYFQPAAVAGPSGSGNGLGTFILGDISLFANVPKEVPGYYRWHYYAGYVQDNWHVTPRTTLNLGLRWEAEIPREEAHGNQAVTRFYPGALNGIPAQLAFCFANGCNHESSLWPTNWKGFEPRIGVSFAPNERTTIRLSYNMQRAPLSGFDFEPDPNLSAPSQGVGGASGGVVQNDVVNYITNPVGSLTSAYTALQGRGPFYSSPGFSPVYVNQSDAVPYFQQWSLTLQYQPAAKTLFQATYQGLKGTHLINNFSTPFNAPNLNTVVSMIKNHTNFGNYSNNPYGVEENGTVETETALQSLYPYQNFFNQDLDEIYPRNGTSEYNSMYLSIDQRVNKGLTFLANYTWSKSLDDIGNTAAGGGGLFNSSNLQNPYDLKDEWSVSTFDQASRFKTGYNFALPFGRGKQFLGNVNRWVDAAVGGWRTSGIITWQDGVPNLVTLGTSGYFYSTTPNGQQNCTTPAGCLSNALPDGYNLRPNIVPGVPLINKNWHKAPLDPYNPTPYLNVAAFTTPGSPDNPAFGDATRTLAGARSPREFLFDGELAKTFGLGGARSFEVLADISNVLNHVVYFATPGTIYNDTLGPPFTNPFGFTDFNASNSGGLSRAVQFEGTFRF